MFKKHHYAPKSIDDIIVDDPETYRRLADYANAIRTDHVLMSGPPGTAKTTAANVIVSTRAKASGSELGPFLDSFEGVNFTEDDLPKIERQWSFQRACGVKAPAVVINEIDKMSPQMREKLKAFMDEQAENGQIIATTNHPHVLSDAFRNRFDEIRLPQVSADKLKERAREVLKSEGVALSEGQLNDLVKATNGSWRDLLSAVQDIVIAYNRAA